MRKFEIASIPVEDFAADNRKTLVCYLQYDRRRGESGYWVTWLPIELDSRGFVSFCVSAMVTTPLSLLESGKRFSQRKLAFWREKIAVDSQIDNSEIRTILREAYNDCLRESVKDWNMPEFDLAILRFSAVNAPAN